MQTKVIFGWTQNGTTEIGGSKTITHDGEDNMDFEVPGSSTNLDFDFSSAAEGRVGYLISSDLPVTVKVNSSSVPAATFVLAANSPEISTVPAADSPITVDITTLFFTNAGSAPATVRVRTLKNAVEA